MKKLVAVVVCLLSLSVLKAQTTDKCYVYGVDFSYAKVYAAEESVEEFARAFEGINMLLISEPIKYDFSRVVNVRVKVVLEPMLKVLANCDYANLKTVDYSYEDPDYEAIVKNYNLPQTEGVGLVLIAKLLDKLGGGACYELLVFDIASREILYQREVDVDAGGFGLRNYWASSVHRIIKTVRVVVA